MLQLTNRVLIFLTNFLYEIQTPFRTVLEQAYSSKIYTVE